MTMTAPITASERLTLGNPAQARQGAVWGDAHACATSVPAARALRWSVLEKVLLFYLHSPFSQQSPVLVCKTNPLMMFFLISDIVDDRLLVAYTVGEGAVLVSPASKIREHGGCLHPFACKSLDRLHVLRYRQCGRQRHKDMHMVGHTTDTKHLASKIIGLFHDDSIQFSFMIKRDGLFTLIGAEYNMIVCLNITHYFITKSERNNCAGEESASLRDACRPSLLLPHTACGVIESQCLRHWHAETYPRLSRISPTRGRTRCFTRNTA